MQAQLTYERVRSALDQLSMSAALASLDNVLELARIDELQPVDVVDRLLDFELKARHDRRVETNLKFAGLPYRQRLDAFDFDAQPSVDPQLIVRLASLSFLDDGANVLLLGPPGVGKTALAVGLASKPSKPATAIHFIACHDFVGRFRKAVRFDRVDRLLTTMLRPSSSSSTRSATHRSTAPRPPSSSRSSPNATTGASPSSSPPTSPGALGARSSPTRS